MNWTVVGGAVAAIALLGGGAWALLRRRGGGFIREPEDAAAAVERAVPGFVVVNAVIGADGQGALVVGERGRVAVVKATRRLAVREVPWRAVRSLGGRVVVETGDWRFGSVVLTGVNALDVRRLAPQLVEKT